MGKVFRIYVEKMPQFAVEAKNVLSEIKSNLRLEGLRDVRLFCRYDAEDVSAEVFEKAKNIIFSEPMVDVIYDELPKEENSRAFAIEFLPGQFDQRADSCEQCISILSGAEKAVVKSAKVYMLIGDISKDDEERIKKYLINPVESREASLEKPETLKAKFDVPTTVETLNGFIDLSKDELNSFIKSYGLAMDLDDILFCQDYFKNTEKRDPTITEIRMIDTYWSDHCRHTTFSTIIDNADIKPDYIKNAYDMYISAREFVYTNKTKPICLMDIATIAMKKLKKEGKLQSLDESEEINACSVKITAEIDGKEEKWLLMFKNETHNHPTEIEPFGGAATCLGGAIRDPLSGRAYVYQAMRVTGSGDPRKSFEETLKGKLPQKKITTTAAHGYSSYGNQIGLATGLVNEIYHEGYVAKRMEIGAVVGAAPYENVVRMVPEKSDVVILLGGRTGRDGCGGATGSSKSHTLDSITTCGAEVQKGNAPIERKIQRLFRNSEVTRMIKRCNDFGAGGVSVAIGELADGLNIDLNAVLKKYEGLDGTELAISESQERMAVVVDKSDMDKFIALAEKENLEAVKVAEVTDTNRLTMKWNDNIIVDLSRDFLSSNGASKNTDVEVADREIKDLFRNEYEGNNMKEKFVSLLSDLNVCSQKGLSERFDSTIGAGTVLMPFGGKYQLTPQQCMAAKLPVLEGNCETCSVMSYGYNPYLSHTSAFHGAVYAIVESISKLVASGCDRNTMWLTLQEYFPRTNGDKKRWGKPFEALLGSLYAQLSLGIAAIGGKDSMSGSFENLDVPETLVSFAVSADNYKNIISPEFKEAGNNVYFLKPTYNENMLPDFESLKALFDKVHDLCVSGKVKSAFAITKGGIAEAIFKMSIGNKIGFRFSDSFKEDIFENVYGGFVIETSEALDEILVGQTTDSETIEIGSEKLCLEELIKIWLSPLEKVFPLNTKEKDETKPEKVSFDKRNTASPVIKTAKPRVLIPVFPGTNCEYDTKRAFEKAGAEANVVVIRNLNGNMIAESVNEIEKAIKESQIVMFPGGFSAGDEPDGSGKFIATFFRNEKIKEAMNDHLKNKDGLVLGICNGFQALVKLGLVPFGEIRELDNTCPTLTYNTIGRHQSMLVNTRVASVKSPWFSLCNVGDIHRVAISHGEGRFVADEKMLKTLIENGQIATQYVDLDGNPTMDITFNPNGSVMAIEGITSPDGRVLGKMAHSERIGGGVYKNVPGDYDQKIFLSGVGYFK